MDMSYEVHGYYNDQWVVVMRLDRLDTALTLLQDLLAKGRAGAYRLEVVPESAPLAG